MHRSTLYIRNAGFGDMLQQINIFFHLSDVFSFSPRVFLSRPQRRNSLNGYTFFDDIGYTSLFDPKPEISRERADSLSQISTIVEPAYRFDARCYNNPKLEEVLAEKEDQIHPRLRELASQSKMYSEVSKRKIAQNHIVLHVRRGDVAQVLADDFPGVFDPLTVAGKIIHCNGAFDEDGLKKALPLGNRRRFASTRSYLDALNMVKKREGVESHILVSDGFAKMSRVLVSKNPDFLVDRSVSADALEKELEEELRPLMCGARKCIIGENNASFYETVFAALSSKIIISQSAGFLRELSLLFDLDIEIVCPELLPTG